jgi:signal transduction histidine kinase
MGTMLGDLEQAVAMVRRMSAELRPSMLDDLGLNAAIEWLVRNTGERLGLTVALQQEQIEPPLEPSSAVAVFRLMEDLMSWLVQSNALADAVVSVQKQAPGLFVSLQARSPTLEEPGESERRMNALQDSVNVLGGQFALESDAAGKIAIVVHVPLEPAQGGDHLRLTEALG